MNKMRAKKLKLADSSVKLLQLQLAEIMRRHNNLLFTNGTRGSSSARDREYFRRRLSNQ